MWSVIASVLQILYLILKNKFEKDSEEKAKKKVLYEEAKTAIVSRDPSQLTGVLDKLRNKNS